MPDNKIKFGLKNTHYAVITEVNGAVSYGIPKPIPGAVNLIQNPVGDPIIHYADDIEYYSEDINNGYDGTLEMSVIPDEFRVDVFGDEIDENGALIENANAKPNKIALMYEFDGDAKKTRHVNYNVKVSRPNVDGSTRTNTKEPKTDTMNIAVRPAIDTGDVKAKISYGQPGYDTFFTAVYLKNAPTNAVSSPASYTKESGTDLEISYTTTATTHTIKDVLIDGVSIGGINVTVDTTAKTVTISDAYLDTFDEGEYVIRIIFGAGNAVDVALTISDAA
jgi:phi13 family phage major tail protein